MNVHLIHMFCFNKLSFVLLLSTKSMLVFCWNHLGWKVWYLNMCRYAEIIFRNFCVSGIWWRSLQVRRIWWYIWDHLYSFISYIRFQYMYIWTTANLQKELFVTLSLSLSHSLFSLMRELYLVLFAGIYRMLQARWAVSWLCPRMLVLSGYHSHCSRSSPRSYDTTSTRTKPAKKMRYISL